MTHRPDQARPAEATLWQALTAGSGLPLAAPVALSIDADALAGDLATVEARIDAAERRQVPHVSGWASICLMEPAHHEHTLGTARPALALMPSVASLLERSGLAVTRTDLIRSPPGFVLDWHYDPLAPHGREARMVIPLRSGPGATTWMSHEAHHWPVGIAWAADFTFPHMMANDGWERVILSIDMLVDDAARRILPPALMADGPARTLLAQQAVGLMLAAGPARGQPAVPSA